MRDSVDLVVITATFVTVCAVATFMSMPALEWATGGPDWKIAIAFTWLIASYLLCAWAGMRFLTWYRHRTTSVGRSQKV